MLNCKEVNDLVTAYLEKRMPLRQRFQFRMHIAMCKHCRAYLRQIRTTLKLTGALPDEPMPPDVRDELARRLSGLRKAQPQPGIGSHVGGVDALDAHGVDDENR